MLYLQRTGNASKTRKLLYSDLPIVGMSANLDKNCLRTGMSGVGGRRPSSAQLEIQKLDGCGFQGRRC